MTDHSVPSPAQASIPGLAVGIALLLGLTVYPALAVGPDGRPDHLAAGLLLWAMCAGFVRGVGFVPRHSLLRAALSLWASLLALGTAGLKLLSTHPALLD